MSATKTKEEKTPSSKKKNSKSSAAGAAVKYPYAIVKTGGKQYRIAEGDMLLIEKVEAEPGSTWKLEEVLLVANGPADVKVGKPTVKGSSVSFEILQQTLDKKINVMHNRRRHNSQKSMGHRQPKTRVVVKSIH